jgi:tRNA (guanine37-N1)-methyltransferase
LNSSHNIVTIFPGFFTGFLENGILRRALAERLVEVSIHDLRAFTHDRHRTVDDRPFGGGEGMVLKPQPIAEALESLGVEPKNKSGSIDSGPSVPIAQDDSRVRESQVRESGPGAPGSLEELRTRVILLSAQGKPFTQAMARELATLDRVVLVCGRYEGVDERINELYCDLELSIGDYVLSGGELAAAVVVDAVMRLIPGVLGNEASGEFESFGVADAEITSDETGVPRSQHGAGGLLDYPHYTRPAEFAGLKAPDVLLNGDHLQIRRWRREQQLRKTLNNRPDLLEKAALSDTDRRFLDSIQER